MTDQLFTDHGHVRPTRRQALSIRRPPVCRYAGCDEVHPGGRGRSYCDAHQCDFDTCERMVRDRGRCDRHAYCKVADCTNMRRQSQAAKYCDEHATSVDYEPRQTVPTPSTGPCVACSMPVTRRRSLGRLPMLLCRSHQHLSDKLCAWRRTYGLDEDGIRKLLTNPRCWVCLRSLAWMMQAFARDGRESAIHVDHDHITGRVRGLAHDRCNRRLGVLEALLADVGSDRMHELVDELVRGRG